MALFENFPYTNFHELNLDWIVKVLKELNDKFDDAISAKITIADPIEWDITKQYPALTLVVDNGTAYLSMQPVPTGTPITNTDYWQQIFDMQTFYDMINDLQEELEDSTAELNNKINDETIKNNSTKTMLYLGDSYSTYYNNQLFNYVRDHIGIPTDKVYNVAVSGASFTDPGNSYLMQLQNYTGDKTAITDILIVGGINDALIEFQNYTWNFPDTTILTNAIDNFVAYAHSNYPNAKLHIAYVGGCLAGSSLYDQYHPDKSQEWALWGYTIYAGSNGFRVLDRTWNAIHGTHLNYASDGVHPSSNYGVEAIGAAVCNAFNDIVNVQNRPTLIVRMNADGITQTSTISAFKRIINDTLELTIPDGYIQIRSGETIGTDYKTIFDMGVNAQNAGMDCKIRNGIFINCMVSLSGFTGLSGLKQVPAELRLENGKIDIKVFSVTGSSFDTLTAGSFSAITFHAIPPIILPIWQVN